MKKHLSVRLLTPLAVGVLALLLTSCDGIGDFGNTNVNPTQATEIDAEYLFTTLQLGTVGSRYENWRGNLIYSENVIQHMATTIGYWVGNFYGYSSSYAAALWEVQYYGGINGSSWAASVKNAEQLVAQLQGQPQKVNLLAATKIWRVLVYQRLTDLYGDIPYFEAGEGFLNGIYQPPYTPQDSIYMDLHEELQEALALFDSSKPTYGASDLVFSGDIAQWKKFANSLQLRLALRLVKVDPATAEAWAQEAIQGGVMQSNADMVYIAMQDGPTSGPVGWNTNPNSRVLTSVGEKVKLSDTFVSWMKEHDDPRLPILGAVIELNNAGDVVSVTTDPAAQMGLPNGYTSTEIRNHPSWPGEETGENGVGPGGIDEYTRVNLIMRGLADPYFFQSYAEVEFMLAVADVRWGLTARSAEQHYEAGVRAAMKTLSLYDPDGDDADISEAAIDQYLAENPFKTGGSMAEKLEQINTQYWIATFLNGYEAWANWKRTGYPKLERADAVGVTQGLIPRRLAYPLDEQSTNHDHYRAARQRQAFTDANKLVAPVWWDCGALADQCNSTGLGPQASPPVDL